MAERVGKLIGLELNDKLVINTAASLALKAHNSRTNPFLVKQLRSSSSIVVFAFRGSIVPDDWLGTQNIDTSNFPSLRSLNDAGVAVVSQSFLRRFNDVLDQSSLAQQVKEAIAKQKQVVFAGYSSAGPMAILATLHLLENSEMKQIHPPRCLTFGSPLVGDRIFGHAVRREGWSDYFTHFVMKHDIIPRIMLSPFSDDDRQEHEQILNYLKSKFDERNANPPPPPCGIYLIVKILNYFKSKFDKKNANPPPPPPPAPSGFYVTVMGNASSVARYDACNLMGCRNPLLDTIKSFTELSPYRPFGTYIFCTGKGNLFVVRNPNVALQILFHSAESEEAGLAEAEKRSLDEHLNYVKGLNQSLEKLAVVYLDSPAENGGPDAAALMDLGLNSQAMLCVQAAEEWEKRRSRTLVHIREYEKKIRSEISKLKRYKENSKIRKVGYYDSFKLQNDDDDFQANVSRLVLAGIYDEIKNLLKEFELPDDFEKNPEFIDLGTEYRRLVEPLDIANFYRHSKDKETGPYMSNGGARPKRYRFMQTWIEHSQKKPFGSPSESCFWAEVEQLRIDIQRRGYDQEIMEKIERLEGNLMKWIDEKSLDDDVLLKNSTFVQWWRELPPQYRSKTEGIEKLIRTKSDSTMKPISLIPRH